MSRFDKPEKDFISLCRFAYKNRRSIFIKQLAEKGREGIYKTSKDSICQDFRNVRHNIGRLGYHFRAAETLVAAPSMLPHLFDDFEVQCLPTPLKSESPPYTDEKTTLGSIIIRMLPKDSPNVHLYQSALADMDNKYQLYERLINTYCNPKFRPRVHAEILVLEHFYENNLIFAGSDRYIGCSKPACYCCSLYFRHHPLKPVQPASHQKIWLNWRPPDLKPGCDISVQNHQRDILNAIIHDIRTDVFCQISQKSPRIGWHPDSVTGMTESIKTGDLPQRELDDTSLKGDSGNNQAYVEDNVLFITMS